MKYFIFILSFFLAGLELFAESKITVKIADKEVKSSYMGVAFVGDTISQEVKIINKGDTTLFLGAGSTYFSIINGTNSSYINDYQEFFAKNQNFPVKIPVGDSLIFSIAYYANPDTITFPLGAKEANVIIHALYDGEFTPILKDTLVFSSYKSSLKMVAVNPMVDFDTVYIKANNSLTLFDTLNNCSNDSIQVKNQVLNPAVGAISHGFEFPNNYFVPKLSFMAWKFSYAPTVRGKDSATFILTYKPELFETVETDLIRPIRGFGGVQKISLDATSGAISGDTIDLGIIDYKTAKSFNFDLKNSGNIPIQGYCSISKISANSDAADFAISQNLFDKGEFAPDSIRKISVTLTPSNIGDILVKYEVATDLLSRAKIHNPDSADAKFIFYVRASVQTAFANFSVDTLDFGEVQLYNACENSDSLKISVSNKGNIILSLSTIACSPSDEPFTVNKSSLNVNVASLENIFVKFAPKTAGDYSATLLVQSNAFYDKNKIIYLKGVALAPKVAPISFPSLSRFKPGSIIEIPIFTDRSLISKSTNYSDTISYERSALQFLELITLNTAVEGSQTIYAEELSSGDRTTLKFETSGANNFKASDTLAIMRFQTYLANKINTNISSINPIFGSKTCANLFEANVNSGEIVMDSVCGLYYKRSGAKLVLFKAQYPNPAKNSCKVSYSSEYATSGNVEIFDVYGSLVKSELIPAINIGDGETSIDLSGLDIGAYAFRFSADSYYYLGSFIIGE